MKERRRLRPVRPLQPRDERPEHNPYRSSTRCCAPRFFSQTADRYTRGRRGDRPRPPHRSARWPVRPGHLPQPRLPYFEPGLQETVGAQLAHALRPAGALVLGAHDQLPAPLRGFAPWDGRRGIYRRQLLPLETSAFRSANRPVARCQQSCRPSAAHSAPSGTLARTDRLKLCAATAFASGLRCNVRANGFQRVWPHPRRLPAH